MLIPGPADGEAYELAEVVGGKRAFRVLCIGRCPLPFDAAPAAYVIDT